MVTGAMAVVAAVVGVASVVAGTGAEDPEALFLLYLVPAACAAAVGLTGRFWPSMLAALVVGAGGGWLALGPADRLDDDRALAAVGVLVLVPLLLGAAVLGLLARLGWEGWHDRPTRPAGPSRG